MQRSIRRALRSLLLRVIQQLWGDDSLELESRLYRLLCVGTTFVLLVMVVPANLLQGLSPWLTVVTVASGLTTAALVWASLRGTHLPRVLFLLVFATINGAWFLNGGSLGSIGYFFPLVYLLAAVFFHGVGRWGAMLVVTLDPIALLFLTHNLPHLVIPFDNPRDRIVDLAFGLVISGVASALIMLIVLASYHREHQRLLQSNREIECRMAEIRTLRGMLPVCAWCRRIRDDQGLWTQVGRYLSEHTEAQITHGLCPECEKKHFPEDDVASKGSTAPKAPAS